MIELERTSEWRTIVTASVRTAMVGSITEGITASQMDRRVIGGAPIMAAMRAIAEIEVRLAIAR